MKKIFNEEGWNLIDPHVSENEITFFFDWENSEFESLDDYLESDEFSKHQKAYEESLKIHPAFYTNVSGSGEPLLVFEF